jgi:hypothetical protein
VFANVPRTLDGVMELNAKTAYLRARMIPRAGFATALCVLLLVGCSESSKSNTAAHRVRAGHESRVPPPGAAMAAIRQYMALHRPSGEGRIVHCDSQRHSFWCAVDYRSGCDVLAVKTTVSGRLAVLPGPGYCIHLTESWSGR